MRLRFGFKAASTLLALIGVVIAVWLLWQRIGGWEAFIAWIMTTQQQLHRQLVTALRAVAQEGASASLSLIGLSLLYGVFHAAGPGHGKAVIATYLGTHAVQWRRGVFLSVVAALAQGVTAIVLVEGAVSVLGLSLRKTQGASLQAETLSFALMALMGTLITARSLRKLWQQRQAARRPTLFASAGRQAMGPMRPIQLYCDDCARAHGPSRAQLNQALSWRTGAGIVLAIGVRPCTGAILVLLVAQAMGLRWTAAAAVLAMSLGTAATVAMLAIIAVSARQLALQLLRPVTRSRRRLGLLLNLLSMAGGLFILAVGVGLLQQGLRMGTHPLM